MIFDFLVKNGIIKPKKKPILPPIPDNGKKPAPKAPKKDEPKPHMGYGYTTPIWENAEPHYDFDEISAAPDKESRDEKFIRRKNIRNLIYNIATQIATSFDKVTSNINREIKRYKGPKLSNEYGQLFNASTNILNAANDIVKNINSADKKDFKEDFTNLKQTLDVFDNTCGVLSRTKNPSGERESQDWTAGDIYYDIRTEIYNLGKYCLDEIYRYYKENNIPTARHYNKYYFSDLMQALDMIIALPEDIKAARELSANAMHKLPQAQVVSQQQNNLAKPSRLETETLGTTLNETRKMKKSNPVLNEAKQMKNMSDRINNIKW